MRTIAFKADIEKKAFLLLTFMLFILESSAQFTSGEIFVCKNSTKTYKYNGGQAGCNVNWLVVGGVFSDHGNNTSFSLTADANGESIMKIKWTSTSSPQVSVSTNCLFGNDSQNIIVDEILLDVSSSSSDISLGQQVTLTAGSNYTNTYSWASTAGGNLSSTSGNPVTASPNSQSVTFTTTATHQFLHNVPPNQATVTCTQQASVVVRVSISSIKGNSICCDQCISSGSTANALSQAAGVIVSGGNGSQLAYQWQKCVDGVSFSNITSGGTSQSHSPGIVTQKTWYRRVISGGGVSSNASGSVIIDAIDAPISPTITATNYPSSIINKAYGTITIQGNQVPAAGVSVDFIADTQIKVQPSTTLSSGITLRIGSLCTSSSGGRIASAGEEFVSEELTESPEQSVSEIDILTIEYTEDYNFLNAYPNPTKGETIIIYKIVEKGGVRIALLDQLGRPVANLVDTDDVEKGTYEFVFNSKALPPGIYFYTLTTGGFQQTKRLSVLN